MNRNHNKRFLIPFLMVATYLLFNVSSTVLFTIRRQHAWLDDHTEMLLLEAGLSFITVGYISDAICISACKGL